MPIPKMNLASLRKLSGIILIVALLAIVLSLYFLQYIPSRQRDFHHSAFLELKQVETSLQERNKAYIQAIQNYLKSPDFQSLPLLNTFFQCKDYSKNAPSKNNRQEAIKNITIEQDILNRKWRIYYNVYNGTTLVKTFSKSLDTLITNLTGNYKDIFDDYLVISDKYLHMEGDSTVKKNKVSKPNGEQQHNGQILYNSGSLSVDFLVNTDSLLKKTDGFSLLNVHDVTIEGNPYKLFLYPMALGEERIILSGLISNDHYNRAFKKIPFNLIALGGVLVLLVLILLPILKIFILGRYERITDMDIRLIIGTYFIATFLGFFLFSNSFLNQTGPVKNKKRLQSLSSQIQQNFVTEIDSICRQLKIYDSTLYKTLPNSYYQEKLRALREENIPETKSFQTDSASMDSLFKPSFYPYLNNFFWIDSGGSWVARWAFKKLYSKSPLIWVGDRQYFRDFVNRQNLILPDSPRYQFTIQPTLSKLDGEYIITVVIPSDTTHREIFKEKWKTSKYSFLVGLGAEMHFVSHALLPQGYNFSIINDAGDILYDSKSGLALLSNILKDVDNPTDILQCARYRNDRYFPSLMLRGRQVGMLATPIKGFPYTLLTYSKISQTEDINEHLIGLPAIMMAIILAVLIFSTSVNEWSKKRNILLSAPNLHFEWLHPSASKKAYYLHLIKFMWVLLAIYLVSWFITEYFIQSSEFSLFFVSVLFPFYLAIHYYLVRENYYNDIKPNERISTLIYPSPKLIGVMLLAVVIIINCFAAKFSGGYGMVLIIQLLFLAAIIYSNSELPNTKVKDTEKFLNYYTVAILTGAVLISIIPAGGIFCLLLRQETNLESVNTQLELAHMINLRRTGYNQRIKDYNFRDSDSFYLHAIHKLKFESGIYTFSGDSVYTVPVFDGKINQNVSKGYSQLHQWFFPEGSLSSRVDSPGSASDSSWYFLDSTGSKNIAGSVLVYRSSVDAYDKDSVIQRGTVNTNRNAASLLIHQMGLAGGVYIALFAGSVLLILFGAYKLTKSLARRIFLIDFFERKNCSHDDNEWVDGMITDPATVAKLKERLWPGEEAKEEREKRDKIAMRDIYDYEKLQQQICGEMNILQTGKLMEDVYSTIWATLNAREKFILYDFAIDGFANYKDGKKLNELLGKGVLFFDDDYRLEMMTMSFREFVLGERDDKNVVTELNRAASKDSWKQFKIPLLLVLSLIGLFTFVTQDMLYQKVTGLLTSLGSLLPLFSSLFSDSNGSHYEKQE